MALIDRTTTAPCQLCPPGSYQDTVAQVWLWDQGSTPAKHHAVLVSICASCAGQILAAFHQNSGVPQEN